MDTEIVSSKTKKRKEGGKFGRIGKKEDLVCIIFLPLFDLPLVLRHLFVHSFWITICLNQVKLSHEFNLTFKSTTKIVLS